MFSNLIVMPCNMQMPFFRLTSWMNVRNNHMVLQFINEILAVSKNECIISSQIISHLNDNYNCIQLLYDKFIFKILFLSSH